MAYTLSEEEICDALTKIKGTKIALVRKWYGDEDQTFYVEIRNEETFVIRLLAEHASYFDVDIESGSVSLKEKQKPLCDYHDAIMASHQSGGAVQLDEHIFLEFGDDSMHISHSNEMLSRGISITVEHATMVNLTSFFLSKLFFPDGL